MVKFCWFSEIKSDGSGGHYDTYGIGAFDARGKKRFISDVDTDIERIRALVSALNAGRAELVHLDEIIENYLYDYKV